MKKTSTRLPALRLDIMVRSRLDLNTTIEQKHATIATAFAELPPPWSWTVPIPAAPRIGGGLCVAATLGRKLGKGISGYAMYTFRHDYEEDAAMHDDWIDISFNARKFDYAIVLDIVLPRLIRSFNAYRAEVSHYDSTVWEWEKQELEGYHGNGRHDVYRIPAVSFFDRDLCQSAFHLTPDAILVRVKTPGFEASILDNGIYIVGSRTPLTLAEEIIIGQSIKDAITDTSPNDTRF